MKVYDYYHKNQFILIDGKDVSFQSYDSEVVRIKDNVIWLGRNWDYSNTTLRHLYLFLQEYCYWLWLEIEETKQLKKFNSYLTTINYMINNDMLNYDYDII